jgi:hypothetical protein
MDVSSGEIDCQWESIEAKSLSISPTGPSATEKPSGFGHGINPLPVSDTGDEYPLEMLSPPVELFR